MASAVRKLRLSVQTKVLIPVLAFLVLLPAIMVWIVNNKVTEQVLAEARQELSTADNVFHQELDRRSKDLLERAGNAMSTAEYKSIAVVAEGESPASADKTIAGFLSDRLVTFGDNCEVMLYSFPQDRAPAGGVRPEASFSLMDFARAVAPITGEALQGKPARGTISLGGSAFFVASVLNKKPNDQPVGAITIGVRIAESELQELGRLIHSDIVLASGNQAIASTLPQFDSVLLPKVSVGSRMAGALAQTQPLVVNGDHYLAVSGAIDLGGRPLGFRYIVLSSLEPSLRALGDTRWTLVAVSVAGFLISAAVVSLFVRRVIQPLRELRDTAEAVGRGDFSRRISRFSNDECGDLADAFNRMTTNLQSSRAELERAVEILKNTQAQLIQSEKLSAVGQFVAGVAHELNNPLTAVIGFSDLLSKTATDEEIRPHLELIAKSAHRCHKIVQNLLSFARQHPPERVLTEVNATIDEVLEIMAYDLRTSNVAIVREFQGDLPAIMADPHQLQQVFVNIVGNARQAIQTFRPDGKIIVRTRLDGPSVRIEFADNGPGIPPENLSRIFDPFFTTKVVGKGTGLGLSLTYGIIQEHRGRISVESEAGRGATFIIELPVAGDGSRAQSAPPPKPARLAPVSGPSGKSILVVDDEQWILSLARQLLVRGGHSVEAVLGAEQAIEALHRGKVDVIVCDWKMPGMNGIQFYEYLLANEPAMAARVLFMSGDVINDSFQEFLSRHKKSCLAKPFAIEEFQSAVEKMLA